jgi:Fe2+ or Zn2+ uptake regulation protein
MEEPVPTVNSIHDIKLSDLASTLIRLPSGDTINLGLLLKMAQDAKVEELRMQYERLLDEVRELKSSGSDPDHSKQDLIRRNNLHLSSVQSTVAWYLLTFDPGVKKSTLLHLLKEKGLFNDKTQNTVYLSLKKLDKAGVLVSPYSDSSAPVRIKDDQKEYVRSLLDLHDLYEKKKNGELAQEVVSEIVN